MARRREMTACPSAVFMRDRKPCVLARRRLFGWKVRFGIVFYLDLYRSGIGNTDYTTSWGAGSCERPQTSASVWAMTTKEVADQLIGFCRDGRFREAIEALY